MLGLEISERTVSRILRKRPRPPSQTWKTFLHNHVGRVTEHPSAAWTSQQIVEAFAEREPPRYLIRDRDGIYGHDVRLRIASLQIEEVLTAPESPWQKDYASYCTSWVPSATT